MKNDLKKNDEYFVMRHKNFCIVEARGAATESPAITWYEIWHKGEAYEKTLVQGLMPAVAKMQEMAQQEDIDARDGTGIYADLADKIKNGPYLQIEESQKAREE